MLILIAKLLASSPFFPHSRREFVKKYFIVPIYTNSDIPRKWDLEPFWVTLLLWGSGIINGALNSNSTNRESSKFPYLFTLFKCLCFSLTLLLKESTNLEGSWHLKIGCRTLPIFLNVLTLANKWCYVHFTSKLQLSLEKNNTMFLGKIASFNSDSSVLFYLNHSCINAWPIDKQYP